MGAGQLKNTSLLPRYTYNRKIYRNYCHFKPSFSAIALKYPLSFGGLFISGNLERWLEAVPGQTEYSVGAMTFKSGTNKIGGPLGDDGNEILVNQVKLYVKKDC